MKTKTIDCVECGEKVSYGRLSCPACGALLASVAGGPARPVLEVAPVDADAADRTEAMDRGEASLEVAVAPDQIALPLDAAADAIAPVDADDAPLAADRAEDAAGAVDAGAASAADPDEHELEPAAFSLSPEPIAALPAAVRTPFDGPEPILVARPTSIVSTSRQTWRPARRRRARTARRP